MKSTLGAITLNTGGVVIGALVLGGVTDVMFSVGLMNQVGSNTPVSGLTIGGLVVAAGFAVSAIYKGGLYLLELGGELEKWKTSLNGATMLATMVTDMGEQVHRTNEQLERTNEQLERTNLTVESHTRAIRDLEEWRATMDPMVFRQKRSASTDRKEQAG